MNKTVKKIIAKVLLVISLTFSLLGIGASVYASTSSDFKFDRANINYRREAPKRILLYNSHSRENYADNYNIQQATKELQMKLLNKGYDVVFLNSDYGRDYNLSYQRSRAGVKVHLENVSSYDLVIDIHRDWGPNPNTVDGAAKIMTVLDSSSKNYQSATKVSNAIHSNIKSISKGNYIYSNTSNYHFNQDLHDKNILLEIGNDKNVKSEILKAVDMLSDSIDKYFKG